MIVLLAERRGFLSSTFCAAGVETLLPQSIASNRMPAKRKAATRILGNLRSWMERQAVKLSFVM